MRRTCASCHVEGWFEYRWCRDCWKQFVRGAAAAAGAWLVAELAPAALRWLRAIVLLVVCLSTPLLSAPLRAIAVPNPKLTPGQVRPITKAVICATKWGVDRRHVTVAMKKQIAQAYGMPYPPKQKVEWDHKVPRELGGEDAISNLWAQPWDEARHVKDPEENKLHKQVCAGEISLAAAQAYFLHWGEKP